MGKRLLANISMDDLIDFGLEMAQMENWSLVAACIAEIFYRAFEDGD